MSERIPSFVLIRRGGISLEGEKSISSEIFDLQILIGGGQKIVPKPPWNLWLRKGVRR